MTDLTELAGKRIVITGAGSGIGLALAERLSREGARLVLADIDAQSLARAQLQLKAHVDFASAFDVADAEAFSRFAADVAAQLGAVDGLVNNAGVGLTGMFHRMPAADFDRVMTVNFGSVVYGVRAFLPLMSAARPGWIVNISSSFGLVGMPGHAAYCASKFAVRGFTETLEFEFSLTRPHIRVIGIFPAGIKTNIVDNAARESARAQARPESGAGGSPQLHKTKVAESLVEPPSTVADAIVEAMLTNRRRVLVGPGAEWTDRLVRDNPEYYREVLAPFVLSPRSAEGSEPA